MHWMPQFHFSSGNQGQTDVALNPFQTLECSSHSSTSAVKGKHVRLTKRRCPDVWLRPEAYLCMDSTTSNPCCNESVWLCAMQASSSCLTRTGMSSTGTRLRDAASKVRDCSAHNLMSGPPADNATR